ncbi:MAG: arginine--tRNA ligase [Peptococcaceae bacterium]|nr:arginine--tRNA ligase [Peptococcaceae bacterium]
MSIYLALQETIKAEIVAALERAKAKGLLDFGCLPPFILEKPREAEHGDLAANVAMILAKEVKKSPREVARVLLEEFQRDGTWVDRLEIAGPGFVNIHLNKDWLFEVIPEVLRAGTRYGSVNIGRGEKVLVEFVSANPTGAPHMGNARGAALGDSLAALLGWAGYHVDREFYINDAGNQIEMLADSLEARYFQGLGVDVPFPEGGYQGQDIIDKAALMIEEVGDRFLSWDMRERREALTDRVIEINVEEMRRVLERFGVFFDRWFSEKSLHESGKIREVLDKLATQGFVYEKEGALWLESTLWGDEKDEVVVRANGIPTYFAADIAYHADKFARGYTRLIDIWGADHHGHVARMKGAMQALGYDADKLEVILMQLVFLMGEDNEFADVNAVDENAVDVNAVDESVTDERVTDGRKRIKQSKREGKYIRLKDLLDEVGVDASRFFFVMRDPDSVVDFDLELAKLELSKNPVFYVQYAHARLCSILREAVERFGEGRMGQEQEGQEQEQEPDYVKPIEAGVEDEVRYRLLVQPEELALLRKLAELPQDVSVAAQLMQPHRLAHYAHDLASLFHTFYHEFRVLVDDKELREARLGLLRATRQALANVLEVLGVQAPERM